MQSAQPTLLNLDTGWRRFGWITCIATVPKIHCPIAGTFLLYENKVLHHKFNFKLKKVINYIQFSFSSITIVLRFEGWGVHDCERTEAAGVQCKEKPPPTTPKPPPTTPRYLRNRK